MIYKVFIFKSTKYTVVLNFARDITELYGAEVSIFWKIKCF